MTASSFAAPAAGTFEGSSLIDWLAAVVERRDLSLAPPANDHADSILALLDAISREFAEYREVVAGAREAARRNADGLQVVVRSTMQQGALVRATASVTTDAETGAARMADAAEALCSFAGGANSAAADAIRNLTAIDAALVEFVQRLANGSGPLAEMRRSTGGVANFLLTLGRLSRHAQLLGVNASIEAAHLADAGTRFAIVAQEVRKLSVSTRESKGDVAQIVGELRESTEHVTIATKDSTAATAAAASEITGASKALVRIGRIIDRFEQMVATVADATGTQSMALQAIGSSVQHISQLADEAALASRNAAELNLDSLLDRAQSKAGRWTLRQSAAPECDPGPFAAWITALVAGADPTAPADVDADARLRPLVAAVRELLEHINAEQRDLLGDVIQVAVAVSRNGYAWRSIGQSLEGVSCEITIVRDTVGESLNATRTSAQIAAGMLKLVDTIRRQYDSALTLLEGALARIGRITTSVQDIYGFVESMSSAAARVDQIMALIETLSSETGLLSLNAAIEAAHAGELGLGFSVIAQEIGALARSTNDSTLSVSQLVATISEVSCGLQTSIGAAATNISEVVASAECVRAAIAILRSSFEAATARALEVAATAPEQSQALERVLENVNASSTAIEENATGVSDRGRLELAMIGSRAHSVAARRTIGSVVERVRSLSESLCTRIEATLEAAVAGGRISLERLFNLRYTLIDEDDIASLGRLFDVSRVPRSGFTPGKFATPWDALVDEAMLDVLTQGWDEAIADKLSPVTIFVSDLNGLFYAYPRQKIAAWTNDPAVDNMGNRIKRFFEDEYALQVGRCGLGPQVANLGPRIPYDEFVAAGCTLSRAPVRPWGGYVYARDTSLVCNEVVTAIYVQGMRHSTLRLCYDPTLI